ncbi:MAG: hypothetical protein GF330_02760 [Candidatus Eisenbacteria bacterium]|nr:hypothetical protein [Candidatus Eisenbacteria bacterium]
MRSLRLLLAVVLLAVTPLAAQAGVGSELSEKGSFGFSLGAMRWFADEDAAEWQGHPVQIRLIGKAVFRYRANLDWVVSVETGFGWNSYAESDDLVTWVIPTTVGLERRVGELWGATTYLAGGAGFYVWGRRRDGDYLRDPVTFKALHATDPGLYVGLTAESPLTQYVTVTAQTSLHFIYSAHADDFEGELGGSDLFADLRLGVNYYFSPYEGLIWGESDEQ